MSTPRPLADTMRPQRFDEVVGQGHLVGPGGLITRLVASKSPTSLVFWGPPGSGKTTLARLYAQAFGAYFEPLSAVLAGVADLRKAVAEAKTRAEGLTPQRTVLFVDEIHRFNKAQQDAFLPYVEDGTIILVGATTENPSFSLNNALLSRVHVLVLNALDDASQKTILARAQQALGGPKLADDVADFLVAQAQGDGRYLAGLYEVLAASGKEGMTLAEASTLISRRAALYDRDGDGHYNLISALHKAVRGSDPDGALYWMCRMLEGGEDPRFVARRLIRMASEDIGLADPQALPLCIAAAETYRTLGTPEGELALAEAVIYLALAPKSNAVYMAYKAARASAAETAHMNPPKIILNAPTQMMKEQGYGTGYQYDHDTPHGFSGQNYFPEGMKRPQYYQPVARGFERDMIKRIEYFNKLRKELNHKS